MWSKTLSKKELVRLLAALDRGEENVLHVINGLPHGDIASDLTAIWFTENFRHELPQVVVVSNGEKLSELFAFTITYLSSLHPFSSFVRVITRDTFEKVLQRGEQKSIFTKVCIAAVMAELLAEVGSKDMFETLPFTSFTTTYSFSMARCLALYPQSNDLSELTSCRWFALRSDTKQQTRKANETSLVNVWSVLTRFTQSSYDSPSTPSGVVSTMLHELRQEKKINNSCWKIVEFQFEGTENLADIILSQPREDRFVIIRKLLAHIVMRPRLSEIEDFLCGYLVSILSDGSLDHTDILFSVIHKFPTCLVWYCVCSALNPNSQIDTWRSGLYRRLQRELLRPMELSNRPASDISYEELVVLMRASAESQQIMQTNSKSISVELIPGVEQVIRWPNKETIRSEPAIDAGLVESELVNHILLLQEQNAKLKNELTEISAGLNRVIATSFSVTPLETTAELATEPVQQTFMLQTTNESTESMSSKKTGAAVRRAKKR